MSEHRIGSASTGRPDLRSLESYLSELQQQYDLLPMQSRLRGEIATRIRQVETEIDARGEP